MGKSRLVYEFTRGLARDSGAVITLEGRCVSYGSLIPYLPLVDLLRAHVRRRRHGSAGRDSRRRRAARCVTTGSRQTPPRGCSVWSASTTTRPRPSRSARRRSRRGPSTCCGCSFSRRGAAQPLVIVVEDLHWIDRTSEEFLTTLVERLAGARVLLVATQRPGYRAPWLDRSYVTHITMSPLTAADSARLVSLDRIRRCARR